EAALRLAGALSEFWFWHGHWRGAQGWMERALARSADAPPSALPRALVGAARFAYYRADNGLAAALGEKGLALSREVGDRDACLVFLLYLSAIANRQEDFTRARTMLDECLHLSRELANDWLQGITLAELGITARVQCELELARAYGTQGLDTLRVV